LKAPPYLEFGSILSYCPRATSETGEFAKEIMKAIKNEYPQIEDPLLGKLPPSEWIAVLVKRYFEILPFNDFFEREAVLVPVPRSSLMRKDALWPSLNVARALERNGLGKLVVALKRVKSLPRSSLVSPTKRPRPLEHHHSMSAEGALTAPALIVMVDDIVTRGHTFLGAAWRLHEIFPKARIVAFAAMRTVSNKREFKRLIDPVRGFIKYRPEKDDAIRRP